MGAVDKIDILSELDELAEYRQLGTVEELRERLFEKTKINKDNNTNKRYISESEFMRFVNDNF